MNWKYFIGKSVAAIDNKIITSKLNFVKNHYPYGRHWIFDQSRILKQQPATIIDAGANIGSISKELNFWF